MFGLAVLIVLALAVTPLLTPADSTKRPQDVQTAARQVVLGAHGAEAGGRAVPATTLLERR